MANTTSPHTAARWFIKRQEVELIASLSCTQFYRRVVVRTSPQQVTIGANSVVCIETAIMAGCDARITEGREVAA